MGLHGDDLGTYRKVTYSPQIDAYVRLWADANGISRDIVRFFIEGIIDYFHGDDLGVVG